MTLNACENCEPLGFKLPEGRVILPCSGVIQRHGRALLTARCAASVRCTRLNNTDVIFQIAISEIL